MNNGFTISKPDDYEVCGTCGYDHEYDGCYPAAYAEIQRLHLEDDRINADTGPSSHKALT